jgi:hypothetical protein
LLDELKRLLLSELKEIPEGRETDRADIEKAKQITSIISKIEAERAEQKADFESQHSGVPEIQRAKSQ